MPKTKSVSEKNTKNEILDAYQELLAQVQENLPISNTVVEEEALVTKAGSDTVAKIVEELTKLKVSLSHTISSLTDQLTAEAERLSTLKKAIAISQKELTETQQIKYQAGLLQQLIIVHKQKDIELEKEMSAKRAAWDGEQATYLENLKRERERARDEYEYQVKLKKSRDAQEQDETRRLFEKEMAEKKQAHAAMLSELEDLRKRAAHWDTEQEQAVKQAVVVAETVLKREAEIVAKLAKQEADNKLSLAERKSCSRRLFFTSVFST